MSGTVPPSKEKQCGDFVYADMEKGVEIVGFKGGALADTLVIPETLDGKKVIRIGKNAFSHRKFISVKIPNTVIRICESAFRSNELLRHIDFPNSVVSVRKQAFASCGLVSLTFGRKIKIIESGAFCRNKLTKLDLPDTVETLGAEAFQYNSLESLTIGKGLKIIPKAAFQHNKIKKVIIPDNVTEVGEGAFECNGLEIAVLPDTTIKIGKDAFRLAKTVKASEYHAAAAKGAPIKTSTDKLPVFTPALAAYAGNTHTLSDARREKLIEAKNLTNVIDLSQKTPAPFGRGWTYADGVYRILHKANVVITGNGKGLNRRVIVERDALKVHITLDNAVLEFGKIARDKKIEASAADSALSLGRETTLWLKGESTVNYMDDMPNITSEKFYAVKAEGILDIAGEGSLTANCGIRSIDYRPVSGDRAGGFIGGCLTVYSGARLNLGRYVNKKGRTLYGTLRAENLVLNGGAVSILGSMLCENSVTVHTGTLTGEHSGGNTLISEFITLNGGALTVLNTATKDIFSGQVTHPHSFAIGTKKFTNVLDGHKRTVLTVNGGTLTAINNADNDAAAIGPGYFERGTFFQNGGVVFCTRTWGLEKERGYMMEDTKDNPREKFPAVHLDMSNVKGGIFFDSKAGKLYSTRVKLLSDVTVPSGYSLELPAKAEIVVLKGVNFERGARLIPAAAVINSPEPPPAAAEFTPDMYTPTFELADYKEIDGFELMRVAAGTFRMGATAEQAEKAEQNERPAHNVTLTRDYYIGIYPVTQRQWVQVMGNNPSAVQGDDLRPVECVSWVDAQDFIAKLNQKTGKKFRLLTEAEWEFAARGGQYSEGYMFSGGNNDADIPRNCNELGLYDMGAKGVGEWVQDLFDPYTALDKQDPVGPAEESKSAGNSSVSFGANVVFSGKLHIGGQSTTYEPNRVIRGGYHYSGRVSRRVSRSANATKAQDIGLRLALTAEINQPLSARVNTQSAVAQVLVKAKKDLPQTVAAPQIPVAVQKSVPFNANAAPSFAMQLVTAGTFTMGTNDFTANSEETPACSVTLTCDYYIGVYPVTQQQWIDIMGSNPSKYGPKFSGEFASHPVENVSYLEVQEFIAKLNAQTGLSFRLPTEAEWEYAARGGSLSKGYKYAGSDEENDVLWHTSNSRSGTKPVGRKLANEIDLYDCNGNVYEWINDYYSDYTAESKTDPRGPEIPPDGDLRVIRGGSVYVSSRNCRLTCRDSKSQSSKKSDIGFRLAHS
ncbi:MAG: SUMF1/EgtB/PvdO family nonheme iron enzyme [Firmicutes bacterium]|nr:SUMF1/EgtB/PvdO family nonheme iron enzyme [Bacillota bacterium]